MEGDYDINTVLFAEHLEKRRKSSGKLLTFDHRAGTDSSHGIDFEKFVIAHLSVKCLQENFEDFWICSNVNGLHAFDDVILYTRNRNGRKNLFFIQLKHKMHVKFSTKKRKHCEDMHLSKYQESYDIIKNFLLPYNVTKFLQTKKLLLSIGVDFDDMHFIFFTNTEIVGDVAPSASKHVQDISFLNTNLASDILQLKNADRDEFSSKFFMFSLQAGILHSEIHSLIQNDLNKFNSYFLNCENFHLTLTDEINKMLTNECCALCKSDLKTLFAKLVLQYTSNLTFSTINFEKWIKWETFITSLKRDSTETLRIFGDLQFNFQGNLIDLQTFVSLYEKLQNMFNFENLIDLLKENLIVNNIFKEHKILPYYFIQRFLSKVYLHKELLENNHELFILLDNYNILENCANLKRKNIIITSDACAARSALKDETILHTNRHVLKIDKCATAHFKIEWLYSNTKDISLLEKYLDAEESKTNPIENFMEYLNFPTNNKLLIVANPGMGKTLFMKYLAYHCPPQFWAIFIILNELDFSKVKDLKTYLECYTKQLNDTDSRIFQNFYASKNIIILLDGFDEIAPYFVEPVLKVINDAIGLGFRIIVSSRESTQNILTKNLQILPRTLPIFSHNDKILFLNKFYSSIVETNPHRIIDFANILLNKLSFTKWDEEFMGIPLQCKMVTECFIEECKTYCATESVQLPDTLNLLQLYEKFVEIKFRLYVEDKKKLHPIFNVSEIENWKTHFENNHMRAAMQIIFPRLGVTLPREFMMEIKTFKEKFGLITGLDQKGQAIFIHRTFAEFFAAKWIYNVVMENGQCANNIDNITIYHYLDQPQYNIVKDLFDRMICKDCKLHLAILNKNYDEIEDCLNGDRTDPKTCGRSGLHLVISRGATHVLHKNVYPSWLKSENDHFLSILKLLLEKINWNDEKEELFSFDPIQIAENRNAFGVINVLFEYRIVEKYTLIENIITQQSGDSKLKDLEYLMWMCVRYEYLHFLEYILSRIDVNDRYRIDFGIPGSTLLHEAINVMNVGSLSLLSVLIKYFDINYLDAIGGNSALYYACINDQINIVEFLISQGAKMFNGNISPIFAASKNQELLVYLTSYDILMKEVNESNFNSVLQGHTDLFKNQKGRGSLLHWACFAGNTETVAKLLEKGIDVNIQNSLGATALHWAVFYNQIECVKLLINAGANVFLTMGYENFGAYAAYHIAEDGNYTELMRMLEIEYEKKGMSPSDIKKIERAVTKNTSGENKSIAKINAKCNRIQQLKSLIFSRWAIKLLLIGVFFITLMVLFSTIFLGNTHKETTCSLASIKNSFFNITQKPNLQCF